METAPRWFWNFRYPPEIKGDETDQHRLLWLCYKDRWPACAAGGLVPRDYLPGIVWDLAGCMLAQP